MNNLLDQATLEIKANIREVARELLDWGNSGKLREGHVHRISKILQGVSRERSLSLTVVLANDVMLEVVANGN